MDVKRVAGGICVFIEWLVKVWRFYRKRHREDALYKGFKRYCTLKLAELENNGVEFDEKHNPQIVNGVFYIIGKYPNGARYEYTCSLEEFKQVKQSVSGTDGGGQANMPSKYGIIRPGEFQERNVYHNHR